MGMRRHPERFARDSGRHCRMQVVACLASRYQQDAPCQGWVAAMEKLDKTFSIF